MRERVGPYRIEISRVERVARFDVGVSLDVFEMAVAAAERLQCELLRDEARSCRTTVRDAIGRVVHIAEGLEQPERRARA